MRVPCAGWPYWSFYRDSVMNYSCNCTGTVLVLSIRMLIRQSSDKAAEAMKLNYSASDGADVAPPTAAWQMKEKQVNAMTQETKGMWLGLIGVAIFSLTLPFTRIAVAELNPVFVALG